MEGICFGINGVCVFLIIIIEDGVNFVVICFVDINVNNDVGFCSVIVSFNVIVIDNCGGIVDIIYS